jgi:hypothetical protein
MVTKPTKGSDYSRVRFPSSPLINMTTAQQARELALKGYDYLTSNNIGDHIEGLQMLDEARKIDYESVCQLDQELECYRSLQIKAFDPKTIIYVADEENNLVQQEIGYMHTSLVPGRYLIYFGIKSVPRKIDLVTDIKIEE